MYAMECHKDIWYKGLELTNNNNNHNDEKKTVRHPPIICILLGHKRADTHHGTPDFQYQHHLLPKQAQRQNRSQELLGKSRQRHRPQQQRTFQILWRSQGSKGFPSAVGEVIPGPRSVCSALLEKIISPL
mmetsp:Transcript_33335/g.33586  ORF Transcript_33335/g.33586 Transcript_33335/m.33586 type:complete len:130 (+) Transcript_33335:183-572(+)